MYLVLPLLRARVALEVSLRSAVGVTRGRRAGAAEEVTAILTCGHVSLLCPVPPQLKQAYIGRFTAGSTAGIFFRK